MGSSDVAQNSSVGLDTSPGLIRAYITAKLDMIRQWSPGRAVSIPCQHSSTPSLTFVIFPPSSRIILRAMGQPPIKAGVYALMHSFDAIKEKATRNPTNVMIGRYKLHLNDKDSTPTLYMVGVHNIVSPTIGICNIGSSLSPEDEHYLFLFRRKKEWALSWDSMTNSCYTSRDSPSFEEDYEVAAFNNSNNNDSDEEDSDDDNDEDDGIVPRMMMRIVERSRRMMLTMMNPLSSNDDNNSNSDGNEVHDDDVSCTEVTPQPRKKKQQR
jgi:hypothetical protein